MFDKRIKPVADRVKVQLEAMAAEPRPVRPFLTQVEAELTRKIVDYNQLAKEIAQLQEFKLALEMHQEFDSLLKYFLAHAAEKGTE